MKSPFDDLDIAWLRSRQGVKWSRFGPDVLPAWIAEMDFRIAPPITDAVRAAIDRADFGYPPFAEGSDLPALFAARMATRYGWTPDIASTLVLPDVMRGVQMALDAFTSPGEGVAVQTPVYPPFLRAIAESGRARADAPLLRGPDRYELDQDALEAVFRDGARLLLLCNPHNPTGRVFGEEELRAIAGLAVAYGVTIVADEIHADLVYPGRRHISFASLGADAAAHTVTLYSASKAFNIAGLRCAVLHAGSDALRERLLALPEHTRHGAGILGLYATSAAWTDGDAWLDEALGYLDRNRRFVSEVLAARLPEVAYAEPEATFLAWFDLRALGVPDAPASFLREHGVALSDGPDFGPPGAGHVRLTFGTSRALLEEILERMAAALTGARGTA